MSYRGKVRNGRVEFDPGPIPPDGVAVLIEAIATPDSPPGEKSLADTLLEFSGIADDLPADLARNHDHYLHGHSKR